MNAMNDTDAMLINELRSLQRGVAARKKRLEALKSLRDKIVSPSEKRYRRYSLEFTFEPPQEVAEDSDAYLDSIGSRVDSLNIGQRFWCGAIETSLRVRASVVGAAGSAAQLTVGYRPIGQGGRQEYLDFFWQIHDTGSDREWQNIKQPSVFAGGGSLSPMIFPTYAKVEPGSEVQVTIDPKFIDFSPEQSVYLSDATALTLHFSFVGYEEAR